MKDIRVFTELSCRFESLPNGKVKEKKWEQGEEAAKEKSRGTGQAPGSRERGRESRRAAEAAGRWAVARTWGRLKSSLWAVGGRCSLGDSGAQESWRCQEWGVRSQGFLQRWAGEWLGRLGEHGSAGQRPS